MTFAGYREDLFHARGRAAGPGPTIVYAGKLSRAKGLPWLLDAAQQLSDALPDLVLHVAHVNGEAVRPLKTVRMGTVSGQSVDYAFRLAVPAEVLGPGRGAEEQFAEQRQVLFGGLARTADGGGRVARRGAG